MQKNFLLKNIFNFSNLAKIMVIYIIILLFVIVRNYNLPIDFQSNRKTITIYSTYGNMGERLLHDRVCKAAKNLHWNVISFSFLPELLSDPIHRHFLKSASYIISLIYKPEFNLNISHHLNFMPLGYNIVYLNVPRDILYDHYNNFKEKYSYLANYDAYIDLYSLANDENVTLRKVLKKLNKQDTPIIKLFLAHNRSSFKPARINNMLIFGSLWGCNRSSFRMLEFFQKLAEDKLLYAYGNKDNKEFGSAYKGSLENLTGKNNSKKLFHLLNENGISLVIHSFNHKMENLPTSRIAESIEAGAIVISEEHSFIKKYFGDNILYFNSFSDTNTMYKQVKKHIEWIKSHPQEVLEKTKKAHEILMQRFALEDQLLKLDKELQFYIK